MDQRCDTSTCGHPGGGPAGRLGALSDARSDTGRGAHSLTVVSDAICPWCYVGKRSIDHALDVLRRDGIHLDLAWLPFELNPDMPPGGLDRRTYRSWKFGSWERSQRLDRHVEEAGRAVGIEFRHDLMERTPNTFNAHRLVWLSGHAGRQSELVERLFEAYFCRGCNIGDTAVLVQIGLDAGLEESQVRSFASEDTAAAEARRELTLVAQLGLNGVPAIVMNGAVILSGAASATSIVEAIRKAMPDRMNQQEELGS